MSYDLWAIPAEHCADVEAVGAHIDTFDHEAASSDAAAALAEVVSAHEGPGLLFSMSPLQPTGDSLFVPVTFASVEACRAVLIPEALSRGFGVFDPQLSLVFHPAEAVSGVLYTYDKGDFPVITPGVTDELIARLDVNAHLIAETGSDQYIQTQRQQEHAFAVEIRDGSPERHFATTLTTAADVATAFRQWITDRASSAAYAEAHWKRLNLG